MKPRLPQEVENEKHASLVRRKKNALEGDGDFLLYGKMEIIISSYKYNDKFLFYFYNITHFYG